MDFSGYYSFISCFSSCCVCSNQGLFQVQGVILEEVHWTVAQGQGTDRSTLKV